MATASIPFLRVITCHPGQTSSIDSVLSTCGEFPGTMAVAHSATSPYMVRPDSRDHKIHIRRTSSLARQRFGSENKPEEKQAEGWTRHRQSQYEAGSMGQEVGSSFGPTAISTSERKSTSGKASGGRKLLNFLQRPFHTKRPKSISKLEHRKSPHDFLGSVDSLTEASVNILHEATPTEVLRILHQQIHLPTELLKIFGIDPSAEARRSTLTLTHPLRTGTLIQPVDSSMADSDGRFCFQVVSRSPEASKFDPVVSLYPAGPSLLAVTGADSSSNHHPLAESSTEHVDGQITFLYACPSAAERNRWMLYLKRLVQPARDLERRRENCLHVWIQEAKGLTGQHRYHCEILLDDKVYARTTSKRLGDMLFWGEEFDLSGVCEFKTLSVNLFRDSDFGSFRDSSASRQHRTSSTPHLTSQRPALAVVSPTRMPNSTVACARGTGMMGPDEIMIEECPSSPTLYTSQQRSNMNKNVAGTVGRKAVTKRGKMKHRKHSLDSCLVATVIIPPEALATTAELESWYPATKLEADTPPRSRHKRSHTIELGTGKSRAGKSHHQSNGVGPTVQLRIKTRHRSVTVLPLTDYARLQHHLARFQPPLPPPLTTATPQNSTSYLNPEVFSQTSTDSALLLSSLDPWLGVKAKAELAGSLVALHQALGQATDFLVVLILHEVFKQPDPNMVLRGNSIATKATEIYLRLVGANYLNSILSEFVHTILSGASQHNCSLSTAKHSPTTTQFFIPDSFPDCEVDPSRLQNSAAQLTRNRSNLLRFVELVWSKIVASETQFPSKLRMMFASVRQHLDAAFPPNGNTAAATAGSVPHATVSEHVISACLFLRYICPAILSPSLFGLITEFPSDQRVLRAFTLVAKTIQSLANFSVFSGAKEGYMSFMNPFVTEQLSSMRRFLGAISSPTPTGSRDLDPTHLVTRDAGLKSSTDTTRVLSSQSHHTGFASLLNGTDEPMGQGSAGYESTSNSSSILTRSISGLPTTGLHPSANSNMVDGLRSPSPFLDSGRQCLTDFSRRIREPLLLPIFPLKGPMLSTAVKEQGYDSAGLSGEQIDLALCLALCHMQLSEAICKVPSDKPIPQVTSLKPILEEIDYFLKSSTDPDPNWWRSISTAPIKQENGVVSQTRNHLVERTVPPLSPPSIPTLKTEPVSTVRSQSSGCLQLNDSENKKPSPNKIDGYELPVSKGFALISSEAADVFRNRKQYGLATSETTERETDKDMQVLPNVEHQLPVVSVIPMTPTEPVVVRKSSPPELAPTRPTYGVPEQTIITTSRSITKAPSEESTLWSIDTESQPKPTTTRSDSPKPVSPNFIHNPKDRTIPTTSCLVYTAANSSSSGYQSLGRHETYNAQPCDPASSTVIQLRECETPATSSFTRENLECTVSNPLYAVHPPPGTPVASCYSGSTPNSPVKQPEKELTATVQATPHRSNSFTDSSNKVRRHTYVNLTNSPTTEALLVAIRKASKPGKPNENSFSPAESHISTRVAVDSDLEVPLLLHRGSEVPRWNNGSSVTPRTIPNGIKQTRLGETEDRPDSVFSGDDTRQNTTLHAVLEGYNIGYPISGSDSVRSVGYLGSARPSLFPVETSSLVPASIRDELDASQARLAEAQARLLANEAERIQLLHAWHNELLRQSQLVTQTSLCSSDDRRWRRPSLPFDPKLSPGKFSTSETTQRLPIDSINSDSGHYSHPVNSALSYTVAVSNNKTSQQTARSQRPPHSAQPRMGASVIGSAMQDPIKSGQSTLPRGRRSGENSSTLWLQVTHPSNDEQWTNIGRSPSTPGLSCATSHRAFSTLTVDYDDLPRSDSMGSDRLTERDRTLVWDSLPRAYIPKSE